MLNIKQEKFITNLLNGMSQRQAYKDAYGAKYRDDVIDRNASKLFNTDEVQMRYRELRDKALEKDILTATERMKFLSDVVNGKVEDTVYYNIKGESTPINKTADLATKIKAVDTLNKMTGEYTQKVEVEAETSFEVNIKVIE